MKTKQKTKAGAVYSALAVIESTTITCVWAARHSKETAEWGRFTGKQVISGGPDWRLLA